MASVTVEVDLDDFTDEEIEAEYNERGLGDGLTASEDRDELMAIRQLVLNHKSKEAYKRMYEYIRNRLGTAI
jgi:diketogulonate reductase-like aldo/keto reductase